MIVFTDIWIRNFLSFGDTLQHINLNTKSITAVLGENYDTGGEDSRNGCGKSGILDALIYCCTGKSIRGITNAKLVNKVMKERMIVIVEYNDGKNCYRIERGLSPNRFMYFVKPMNNIDPWEKKDQNTKQFLYSKNLKTADDTNSLIEESIGMDFDLFKTLVTLSSENEPFFKLGEEKKRDIVESLFGIKMLAKRAEELKKQRKNRKIELSREESNLIANKQANDRISLQIADMENKSKSWEKNNLSSIQDFQRKIEKYNSINFQEEFEKHKLLNDLKIQLQEVKQYLILEEQKIHSEKKEYQILLSKYNNEVLSLDKEKNILIRDKNRYEKLLEDSVSEYDSLQKSVCPKCSQPWHDNLNSVSVCENNIVEYSNKIEEISIEINNHHLKYPESPIEPIIKDSPYIITLKSDINKIQNEISNISVIYNTLDIATKESMVSIQLEEKLNELLLEQNPYLSSIENLQKQALVDIDYTNLNELKKYVEHSDQLIYLLTNSDSFIRKGLINKYVGVLNKQIKLYLQGLELPHKLVFNSDLSCEIMLGREEYDYSNLSKGERLRVTLALNFAFQDIYEYMNDKINLLMIDELLDNGMCARGANNAIDILRSFIDTKGKSVFLITHRSDITSLVDSVMTIVKQNGVSTIN